MLRKISWEQLITWIAYNELEPFGEQRADLRAASICSMIANVNRDAKKRRKPFDISEFMLVFDEDEIQPKKEEKRQTWQEQKFIAKMIAAAYNESKPKRRYAR